MPLAHAHWLPFIGIPYSNMLKTAGRGGMTRERGPRLAAHDHAAMGAREGEELGAELGDVVAVALRVDLDPAAPGRGGAVIRCATSRSCIAYCVRG
jgi:hypothetical protein